MIYTRTFWFYSKKSELTEKKPRLRCKIEVFNDDWINFNSERFLLMVFPRKYDMKMETCEGNKFVISLYNRFFWKYLWCSRSIEPRLSIVYVNKFGSMWYDNDGDDDDDDYGDYQISNCLKGIFVYSQRPQSKDKLRFNKWIQHACGNFWWSSFESCDIKRTIILHRASREKKHTYTHGIINV